MSASEWTDRDARQADARAEYEKIMTTPGPDPTGAYIDAGVIGFVFGEMWRRGVLTPRDRRFITLSCVAYYVGLELYAAFVFVGEARRATGVTRRRMQALASGSAFLGLTILVAGFQAIMPTYKGQVSEEDIVRLIAYIKSLAGREGKKQ